jgi:16S rRNA (guanine527-N7)-methyltransferase
MKIEPRDILRRGCKRFGIQLDDYTLDQFMTYMNELKRWNRVYSLTSLENEKDIVIKHFLDSILYLTIMPEEISRIADAGSGAGFPGLPVKIIRPGLYVSLIESSRKKVAFLKNIIRRLNLSGVEVIHGRTEALDRKYEGYFDAILSRATFKVKEFIKVASPYVRDGGSLIISKGPGYLQEIEGLNMDNLEIMDYRLPFAGHKRILIKIIK